MPPESLNPDDVQEARELADAMLADDQLREDTAAALKNTAIDDTRYLESLRFSMTLFEHARQSAQQERKSA
jgi:hypothetical protein